MRVFLWFSILFQLSRLTLAQEIQVDFRIKNFPDSIAYIGYHFGSQKYILDTLQVQQDAFSLTIPEAKVKPGLYFIYTPRYFFEFVLEAHSFQIQAEYGKGYDTFMPSGSPENSLFKSFQLELGGLQKEQLALQKALQDGTGDSLQVKSRLIEVDSAVDAFRQNIVTNYPESFMASFLSLMDNVEMPDFSYEADPLKQRNLQFQYYKDHYFDEVELSDDRLLRTPLLHEKVMTYFEQLVQGPPESINQDLDWFFDQLGESPELFRYWLVTLFKHYAESKVMGMDAVMVHLIEDYYLTDRVDWIDDAYESKLREEVVFRKPNLIGNPAPALNVVDTLMQPFQLSELNAPYTLVFIYDPDCGHCKKTIAELEQADAELYNLDVRILAVCTITDLERWKEFVHNANPNWIHTIDPSGQSYFRVSYNVRSTPKMYLLDSEKRIIAKQLDVDQLIDFLKRIR